MERGRRRKERKLLDYDGTRPWRLMQNSKNEDECNKREKSQPAWRADEHIALISSATALGDRYRQKSVKRSECSLTNDRASLGLGLTPAVESRYDPSVEEVSRRLEFEASSNGEEGGT
jgi:hypothetical protein